MLVIAVLLAAAGLTGCTAGGSLAAVTTADPGEAAVASASTSQAASSTSPAAGTTTPPAPPPTVVQLQPGASDEASGIAASTHVPGGYFLIDDATGTDQIVMVSSSGAVVRRFTVGGMSASNAEALASGSCGATPLPQSSNAQNLSLIHI